MAILIGGAWPYANGSMHLGHVSSLLPADVLARYFRQKGEEVLYVSGSDCHGTPISIKANQEGVTPKEIANRYHEEFAECFSKLGFSYDLYTRTDTEFHAKVVQDLFLVLLEKEYIYKKTVKQTFCETCDQFLPDRYVEGICPHCHNVARGDQCDFCSSLLDPSDLIHKKCKICGNEPTEKETFHYFFALSKFEETLKDYVNKAGHWKDNAKNLSLRYINEGLIDRAATRDLPWGVDVPLDDCKGKKIYVWIEAVTGYLSASKLWAELNNKDWRPFWQQDATAYYVHGKDNIPFHTLILPALLLGYGGLKLPDNIISSEYLTLEGKKLSTSRNWAVWVPDILESYHPDSIRYFLISNAPEKRDADFSWREFIYSHNSELLGAFGNFVNRSLVFINKSFNGLIPKGEMNQTIQLQLEQLYQEAGSKIASGEIKEALELIFAFIRSANKYFDEQKPWIQVKEAYEDCAGTLHTCVQIIANLSNLLYPFLPFSAQKIKDFFGLPAPNWEYIQVSEEQPILNLEILFERIDVSVIDEEVKKLESNLV